MTKPKQIIKVGRWKGASAINRVRHALPINSDVTVLCIDTWLGSNEVLWSDPTLRPLLRLKHGYPTVYCQFLRNIIGEGLTDTIFPLPMTFISTAELPAPDLINIDEAHGEYEVYGDLIHHWPLVRSGGVEQGLALETNAGKWFMTKSA